MRHDAVRHIGASAPLSEAVTLILLSLADHPRHGYSILKDVEELSEGRVVLSTGTLYAAIQRLLSDQWIERYAEDNATRGRVAYRLTTEGKQRLEEEANRMTRLAILAALRTRAQEG